MLRVSKLADYGTVVMASMAREPHRVHSAAEVANRIGLAAPTVSKILKTLTRHGLVTSSRGAKGGYRLRCDPAQISVAQIIDAMDGPIGMTECSTAPGVCSQEAACTVRANWQTINHIVLDALQRVTLDQMTRPIAHRVPLAALKRMPAAPLA
ncbi:MAG TPA: SUF system Fe-S cluster assembly regulator [Casimicrobiaceae bacterium]|nr:SUF system Fe-S cluster assembly regulator [Casimicrobiaceae bacterium]